MAKTAKKKAKRRGRPPKPPHEKRVLLTVSIDPDQRAWIDAECKARGRGRSEFVREIIDLARGKL
ncbi:MAG: ribbon-helix-helix domain-containing protein [Planctomycetes bacterium]|nr:ribbon-helix-helix domain-containing protein [Planctomycetota bacterium]